MTAKIQAKLRSQSGVSMMIALLFLMFCVFIGGSVLAAATVNTRRIQQLRDQQDQLISRSTAMLLGDELQLNYGENLRIKVLDVDRTVYDIRAENGMYTLLNTKVIPPVREREVTFTVASRFAAGHAMKPLQRLQLEAAILRYLFEHPTPNEVVELVNVVDFPDTCGTVSGISDFWIKTTSGSDAVEGTLMVKASTSSSVVVPDFELTVSCGSGDDCYDLFLAVGDPAPVRLRVRAYDNTVPTPGVKPGDLPDMPESGSLPISALPAGSYEPFQQRYRDDYSFRGNTLYVVTHEQNNVAIGWEEPLVEKGGTE